MGLRELKRTFDGLGMHAKVILMVISPFLVGLSSISLIVAGLALNLHWALVWLLGAVPSAIGATCVVSILLKRRKRPQEWRFENKPNPKAVDELVELLNAQKRD